MEQETVQRSDKDGVHYRFSAKTRKPLKEFKSDLTRELDGSWIRLIRMLRYRWRDETCWMTTIGADGFAKLENETIVAEVNFKYWPATLPWVKERILGDVERMTKIVMQYSAAQAKDETDRTQLMRQAEETYIESLTREVEADQLIRRWQVIDEISRLLLATCATTSAVSAWKLWVTHPRAWGFLAGTAAVLSVIHAALRVPDRLKDWGQIKGNFVRLRIDLETFIYAMEGDQSFPPGEFRKTFVEYRKRYEEALDRRKSDIMLTDGLEGKAKTKALEIKERQYQAIAPKRSDQSNSSPGSAEAATASQTVSSKRILSSLRARLQKSKAKPIPS